MLTEVILESIINQLNHAVIICDKDGNFILWNTAAKEMIDLEEDIASTGTWQDYYYASKEDGSIYKDKDYPIMRAVLNGEIVKRERMLINNRSKGITTWLEVDAFPIKNQEGDIIAGAASFMDITRSLRLESLVDEITTQFEHLKQLITNNFFK